MTPTVKRAVAGATLIAAFAVLAVFNSGGYRYGASDQAFYVPAIMRHVDPALFPRDRALIDAQDDLVLATRLLAAIVVVTGASVAHVLFGAYLLMLLAVAGAGWMFGRALLDTRWGAAALVLAMSIRHRVPKTGVNTLEHYFQPRMIAFALGTAGLAALVRRRTGLALVLAIGAGVVHPTTGLWFCVIIGGGAMLAFREQRPSLLVLAAAAAGAVAVMLYSGVVADRLVVMDPEWLQSLATKDYLFPNQWSAATWLQHALYIVVIAVSFRARARLRLAGRGEHALAAGLLVMLVALFAALPLVSARIALAVQLQVSRAMWVFDLLAVTLRRLVAGRGTLVRATVSLSRAAGQSLWSRCARWPAAPTSCSSRRPALPLSAWALRGTRGSTPWSGCGAGRSTPTCSRIPATRGGTVRASASPRRVTCSSRR